MIPSAFAAWDVKDNALRSEIVRNRIAALMLDRALALEKASSPASSVDDRIQTR